MSDEQAQELAQSTLPALAPDETRELLRAAIEKGGVEAIERIAALYERAQEKAAARAYHEALSRFAAEMKPIEKTRKAVIVTRSGSNYSYSYAPLEHIARTIAGPLKAVGLAYTWDSDVADERITVICTVRHIEGHSESAKFTCPTESSGSMNAQQKVAAALTFGRRQSLVQALGLTSCDQDDDGANPTTGERISINQALDLETLLKDSGADKERFLKWLKVDAIENIPVARLPEAIQALETKQRKGE